VKCIRVPDGARISNSRLKPPKGDVVSEAIAAGEGGCSARQDLDLQLPGRHMTQNASTLMHAWYKLLCSPEMAGGNARHISACSDMLLCCLGQPAGQARPAGCRGGVTSGNSL